MDKQEIIDEIMRAAKLNNGKALGVQRFEKETGIKKSDWYPYHWLRWSDAIKEAGLVPNQLNTAFSKEVVIEKLIVLIKEIELPSCWRVSYQSKTGCYISES